MCCRLVSVARLTAQQVIGLTPPFAVTRELTLPGRAVPANACWSPHSSHASFIASHSGQAVQVWNLLDARTPLQVRDSSSKMGLCSLLAHSHDQTTLTHKRNVRGVAWSPFDPAIIATAAADNAIHLWDVRDSRNAKELASFKVFTSGISMVRWNKINPNILASAHDQQVEIWDIRKNAPMTFITAHPSRVSSIDWSGLHEWNIVTAGMDGAVKLWDVKKSRICQGSVATGSAVGKAAYLPNQDSVVVLNTDIAMKVYSARTNLEQSAALMGTRDVCSHFAVQSNGGVVAWSRDGHLCVWDLSAMANVGASPATALVGATAAGLPVPLPPTITVATSVDSAKGEFPTLSKTPTPADYAPPTPGSTHVAARDVQPLSPLRRAEKQPSQYSLREEMDAALLYGNGLKVKCDVGGRQVLVDVAGHSQVRISFPSLYPHNASPSFELVRTALSTDAVVQLLAVLSATAKQSTGRSKPCLAAVLQAISHHFALDSEGADLALLKKKLGPKPASAGSEDLQPCPRMSGATFSPSGRLVVFTNCTPPLPSLRIASALLETLLAAPKGSFAPTVTHYALPNLMPLSVPLAAKYVLRPTGKHSVDILLSNRRFDVHTCGSLSSKRRVRVAQRKRSLSP